MSIKHYQLGLYIVLIWLSLPDNNEALPRCFKRYCFKHLHSSLTSDCGKGSWILEISDQASLDDFKSFLSLENSYRNILVNIWQFQSRSMFWTVDSYGLTVVKNINQLADRYGALTTNGSLIIGNENERKYFVCQYHIPQECTEKEGLMLKVGSSCFVLSDVKETWILARSECLKKGGDLAILDDDMIDLLVPTLKFSEGYWIKLRNKAWIWMKSRAEVSHAGLRTLKSITNAVNVVILKREDLSFHLATFNPNDVTVICMTKKTSNPRMVRDAAEEVTTPFVLSFDELLVSDSTFEMRLYIILTATAMALLTAITWIEYKIEEKKVKILKMNTHRN